MAIAVTASLVLLVPYLAWWSRLPDPVATHFDLGGKADGSMGRLGNLLVCGTLAGAGLVMLMALAIRKSPLPSGVGSYVGFVGGFLAAIGAFLASAIAFSQRDLSAWQDAEFSNVSTSLLIAVAVLAGSAAGRAGGSLIAQQVPQPSSTAPAIEFRSNQQAFWTGRATSRSFQIVAVGFIAAATTATLRAQSLTGAGLLVAAAAIATLSIIRVSAGKHGLTIHYGLARWPRTKILTAEIIAATPIDVRPVQWGGWGYRGSLRLTKQAAVVLRSGPGLHLALTRDRTFVVTLDEPEIPAALLTAEVASGGPIAEAATDD